MLTLSPYQKHHHYLPHSRLKAGGRGRKLSLGDWAGKGKEQKVARAGWLFSAFGVKGSKNEAGWGRRKGRKGQVPRKGTPRCERGRGTGQGRTHLTLELNCSFTGPWRVMAEDPEWHEVVERA